MAMAAPFIAMASNMQGGGSAEKRRRTSSDALQRTVVSDVPYELHHHRRQGEHDDGGRRRRRAAEAAPAAGQKKHPRPVAEVEDARCECCGMSEECTPAYIGAVRQRFSGRWVCGLCAAAVTEEAGKNGGEREAALRAHTAVCKRFNGFGRTHPVLFQAEAMREILRKRSKLGPRSRSSINPREVRNGAAASAAAAGGIARSSSCMPFITDEFNQRVNLK
uniref:DUF1677 family protein n=1 Tax=Oryza brachyantha TaxID=4533 RepID=J3MEZ4_ORYBR